MKTLNKSKEQILKELQELQQEYNSLKATFNKNLFLHKRTEEKLHEKELEESLQEYRNLIEISPVAMSIVKDWKAIYFNPAAVQLFGAETESELIGKHIYELIHPDFQELAIENSKSLAEKGYINMQEQKYLKLDGTVLDVETQAKSIRFNDSNATLVVIKDITERKMAEQELKKSDLIFRHSIDMLCIAGFDGYFKVLNPAWSKTLGWTTEELLSKPWNDFVHPDDLDNTNNIKSVLVDNQEIYQFENRYLCKNGSFKWLSWNSFPYKEDNIMFGVARDVTDRKAVEQELLEAKIHAEESDRLKSAFLANMSHEIRTPMNGILGFAELLKEPNLSGEEHEKYIKIIEKSGVRMLNIINDIVDISKIEAGLMKLYITETNINEQIEYIYTFFKPEVEEKGINFSFKNALSTREAIINTDCEKVYAILTNLVKNSIKYTENGSIELGYGIIEGLHSKSVLQFYVKDTGIGIPKEKQIAVFERFIQADISDAKAKQGAGLGLSITKAYVEMLGGTIWVESNEGMGSTFYFTLPYNT